jgi:hypothetical protein
LVAATGSDAVTVGGSIRGADADADGKNNNPVTNASRAGTGRGDRRMKGR